MARPACFLFFLASLCRLLAFHISVSDYDGNAPVKKQKGKKKKKKKGGVGWSFPQIDLPSAAQSLSQDSVHRLQHF